MEMGKVFKTNEGKNDVIKFYDQFLQKLALSYEKVLCGYEIWKDVYYS